MGFYSLLKRVLSYKVNVVVYTGLKARFNDQDFVTVPYRLHIFYTTEKSTFD